MQRITPVLTEKTMSDAKLGKYTFLVGKNITKDHIKKIVNDAFKVKVVSVWTANSKKLSKKNNRGRIRVTQPVKKAIVKLSGKDKIDLFDTKEK